MSPLLLFVVLLFYLNYAEAQHSIVPSSLIEEAHLHRNKGEFVKALQIHKKIHRSNPTHIINNYNYACLYGSIGKKDSCLKYLKLSIKKSIGLFPLSDPDLSFLHNTEEWDSIENRIIKINYERVKLFKDLDYAKKLYRLCAVDQALYTNLEIAKNKYGYDSKEVRAIWKKKETLNKKNQIAFEKLLDEKGWPKLSDVGKIAATSAFLIIQHADLKKMKQHLPTIKKLCNKGEGSCQAFAMMFDRIQCYENKPQRYGTQIRYDTTRKKYELFPLENEGLVHEYREWAGLGPLEHYVKKWNIELNIKKKERDFAYADSLVKAELPSESKMHGFRGVIFKDADSRKRIPQFVTVDPKCILGSKIDGCLTMPKGTEVIVMFVDNQVIDYPDQDDLFIKELGRANDRALVYVSNDGKKYDSLGISFDGRSCSLDLESIQYPHPVKFVKIIALDNNGGLPGYDLVYIKGLPGSNIDAKMTKKEIKNYLANAKKEVDQILGLQIKKGPSKITSFPRSGSFGLKKVHFNSRRAVILNQSIPYLNKLVDELKKTKWKEIILVGHTDNQGSAQSNSTLSIKRANAIRDYLLTKGISEKNITCKGYGATRPLKSNKTIKGRAQNRRVEILIVQ